MIPTFLCLLFLSALNMEIFAQTPLIKNSTDKLTIQMEEADIIELIQWISLHTGKNIIIDPRVKGKVTVIAGDPMTPQQAYEVFLSVLQVHNFAVVETPSALKVIPAVSAKSASVPVIDEAGQVVSTDDLVVRVIKVHNTPAQQMVALLRPLVPDVSHLAAFPGSNSLILSDRAANAQRIINIIRRIDQAGETYIEVVALQYANAQDLVNVLRNQMNRENPAFPGGQKPRVGADARSNTLLISAPPKERRKILSIIQRLDQPAERTQQTQVVYLHYQEAEAVLPIIQGMLDTANKGVLKQVTKNMPTSVTVNKSANALVISAPPPLMQSLLDVVRQLDIRRAQVLVEAIIVEVNGTFNKEIGIDWFSSDSAITGNAPGSFGASNLGFAGADLAGSLGQLGSGDGAFPLNAGLTFGFFRNGSLRSLVRALQRNVNANILSTPTLVTLDNEEASIHVGEEIGVITQSRGTEGDVDNPIQTFDRRDVGLKLKITPRINQGDSITLAIEQETSSVQDNADGGNPRFNKRTINTKVLVEDNQVLVLGGLIRDDIQKTKNKVPVLGSLPVIGSLFTSTRETDTKVNLMVFLHPVIIKDAIAGDRLSAKRYQFMQGKRQGYLDGLEALFPRVMPTLLPDIRTRKAQQSYGE